jgi:hypothetical protein
MTQVILNSEIEMHGESPEEDAENENSPEYSECDINQFENFQHLGNEQVVIRGTTSRSHTSRSSEEELMQWHVRFGHMPMSRIQAIAKEGFFQDVWFHGRFSCALDACMGN